MWHFFSKRMGFLISFHLLYTLNFLQQIMNKGTVKFFNATKGFGFIKEEETGTEYFVHVSGLIDEINENDEVTFELKEGRRGINAVEVKLA